MRCIFVCNLRQTQRMCYTPIDAMLQFDANANTHAHANA